MSPEQAATGGLDVDTRSDVFSLGVVLYELLAGVRPYPDVDPGPSGWEMHRRRLTEDTPRRPSSRLTEAIGDLHEKLETRPEGTQGLARRLRGDLDWIVLRSLERDRERRYAAAADLAADLRRYLAREPISAGPPGRLYRISKFIQRHRVPVASAVVIILALIVGASFATLGLVRARTAQREAVTAREAAEREAAASAELANFMIGLFEVSDPGEARGNAVTAREILDRGVVRIRSELASQPQVQARLMNTMGNVYLQLGLYPESTELLNEAVALRRTALGSDDAELATTLLALGKVERRQMHLDEARASFEEAMHIRERVHGPDSPEVEEVLRSLAVVHRLLGDTDTALAQLERSLTLAEAHYGPRHRETASVLNNLAVAAYQAGDLARARQALERSLAILEPELGSDHPDVGTLLNNLGMIARRQGDNLNAMAYYERTLEASRQVLGDGHPDVAFTLRNLGFAQMAMGKYAAARGAFEESLEILAAAMGPDNVSVGDAHGVLADLAVREGRLVDAEESVRRALQLYGVPENHQQQRKCLRLLEAHARIARLLGQPVLARTTCRQAIREASNLQDPVQEAARCQVQLAILAWRDGDRDLAWSLYREATADLADDQASYLDDPADTASRAAFLGLVGDRDRAFKLLELGFASGRVDAWVRDNPDLEPLRSDPRWTEVVASLGRHLNSANL
jgi:non-specific serine/threonine protein kinase/serine/threonine-protein kinase